MMNELNDHCVALLVNTHDLLVALTYLARVSLASLLPTPILEEG